MVTLWITSVLSILLGVVVIEVHSLFRGTSYERDMASSAGWAQGAGHRLAAELHRHRGDTDDRARRSGLGFWLVYPPLDVGDEAAAKQVYTPSVITGSYAAPWDCTPIAVDDRPTDTGLIWIEVEVSAEDRKLPLEQVLKQTDGEMLLQQVPNMTAPLAAAICHEREITRTPYSCVEDVLNRVDLMTPERYRGTADIPGFDQLLTTYSDGRVYLNGASRDVLGALPGLYEDSQKGYETVDNIVARLAKAGGDSSQFFLHIEELQQVQGVDPETLKRVTPWLKTVPEYYRIAARANVRGVLSTYEGVLHVDAKGAKSLFVWLAGG
ncbi:MAG: hypothetical protein A3K19_07035 [Lentisphaerae bacterium RIFOXYB12_FULL_65_16]|nr:MAG: hypothetical protein A3K18_12290 [Lentisphaerae bacterium RIFOXYA12_64_32]OGV93276.1 MAG: hypothetical protein A3K19_07035 [Lentisphaerae bacterium RIFOXYB12_FULL_65_16]